MFLFLFKMTDSSIWFESAVPRRPLPRVSVFCARGCRGLQDNYVWESDAEEVLWGGVAMLSDDDCTYWSECDDGDMSSVSLAAPPPRLAEQIEPSGAIRTGSNCRRIISSLQARTAGTHNSHGRAGNKTMVENETPKFGNGRKRSDGSVGERRAGMGGLRALKNLRKRFVRLH